MYAPDWLTSDTPVELVPNVIHPDVIWGCTSCRACEEQCPVMISYVDKIVDLRRQQWKLGARPGSLVRLVMGEGIALAAAGVGVGLVAAALATRLLEAQLFGVAPLDPLTFVVVPAVLLVVAAFAAYLPARRAAAVNPVVALSAD